MKNIVIDPVTRLEGHAKITIHLDDQGAVDDAFFHVTQFRGFEKLVEGRPYTEMPAVMARICGICPVSHLIASAKACDALMSVTIPETANNLRRLMNMAQIVQSHALSFFHLSSPDLLLGMDAPVEKRNIFGLLEKSPEIARDGIRLRQFGQEVIEFLGGKKIHPAWIVPGGVNNPLTRDDCDQILKRIPEARTIIERAIKLYKSVESQFEDEIQHFGNFDSMFLSIVRENKELTFYDGDLRLKGPDGKVIIDEIDPNDYKEYIGEAVEPWSYLKFPYWKPLGYPDGMYRVGPMARLNNVDRCGTTRADEELQLYRSKQDPFPKSCFYFHYARLIEIMFCIERMEEILISRDITNPHVRAIAEPNQFEGIGMSEAPRGTLVHHYKIDENGLMEWANLIIATGHNNLAMNRSIKQVAQKYVKSDSLKEGMLNRVEAVIRTFDPCLSCSTHAIGKMPLHIQLLDNQKHVLDEVTR